MTVTGEADPVPLSAFGKAWRAAAFAVVTGLFVAGSLVGDDHWWPFAPWRMFSTSTPPSGAVVSLSIEHRVAGDPVWRPASLSPPQVGLNRAEVEGRVPEMTERPEILGTLAEAHARLHPGSPAWTGVRVIRSEVVLADRRPTGEVRRRVVASWEAP